MHLLMTELSLVGRTKRCKQYKHIKTEFETAVKREVRGKFLKR